MVFGKRMIGALISILGIQPTIFYYSPGDTGVLIDGTDLEAPIMGVIYDAERNIKGIHLLSGQVWASLGNFSLQLPAKVQKVKFYGGGFFSFDLDGERYADRIIGGGTTLADCDYELDFWFHASDIKNAFYKTKNKKDFAVRIFNQHIIDAPDGPLPPEEHKVVKQTELCFVKGAGLQILHFSNLNEKEEKKLIQSFEIY